MAFAWDKLTRMIVALAEVAMRFYKLVTGKNADPNP